MSKSVLHRGAGDGVAGAAAAADGALIAAALQDLYPRARTELDHRDALELLVATVLSAQTTDVRVNQVTPELFRRWPDARALAEADEARLAEVVRPLGMGATRARRLIGLGQGLLERHEGEVPDDQAALEQLSGVGRKTAHVVRGAWFGHSLLAVDTHVSRLARRLGWTTRSDPRGIEADLVARLEADGVASAGGAGAAGAAAGGGAGADADRAGADAGDLTVLGLRLILHGRRVCTARAPRCGDCALRELCPQVGVA
ncbi:endonuclease III [Brachybacterium paraconglomeratum]|uniref:endonuclease III domain-containing protein n=1 Tax=Brachybacterium paraconglomeratum TaxID=173362 RepID=UPI0031F0D42F